MTWRQGGAYALLGPSGCGKTTLLNLISGIVTPSRGKILFDGSRHHAAVDAEAQYRPGVPVPGDLRHHDGRAKSGIPAEEPRRAQSGDRQHGSPRSRSCSTSRLILRARRSRLTADAKQKISLGRGLVRSDVAAILFDEPLTVIDPELKWQLRSKLKALHRALDLTMIYVTHDQTEALTFADTVVVMHDGRVVQSGTPAELFDKPAHTFVGYFIGSPGMNIVPAEVQRARGADRRPHHRARTAAMTACRRGAKIEIGVRPEFVDVAPPAPGLLVGRHRAHRRPRPCSFRAGADRRRQVFRQACRRDFPLPATPRAWCSIRRTFTSTPTASWSRGRPDGQDRQPEGLVPGAAGVPGGGVLGDPAADDGGELFDAGHLRQQPVLLERRRLVQGTARSVDRSRRAGFLHRCGATCFSPP